ncbi:hypothetical protein HY950_03920 [Candidatus Gottesmanbacteria bacterium]|nr:hypothetical protein [Candidatus Gottesmanbacteria bacterium]
MARGKLVVFEDTDGSGKRTQLALLAEYFKQHSSPFATMDFPRYNESLFGELAGRMLKGEFGNIDQLPSHLAVLPFAADRWLLKNDLVRWLNEGKIVVSNRYTASSAVYYAAKLPEDKRSEFIRWVYTMEQEVIGLPKEDLVIYLHLPTNLAQSLIDKRSQAGEQAKDIYERNEQLLTIVEDLYGQLVAERSNWRVIECAVGDTIRSREEIHKHALDILTQTGIYNS